MNKYISDLNEAIIDTASDKSGEAILATVGTVIGGPIAGVAVPIAMKFLANIIKSSMQTVTKDMSFRQLSDIQLAKLERVCKAMSVTLLELSKTNTEQCAAMHPEAADYLQSTFETAEHVFMTAITESQWAKLDVLGKFYAKAIYTDNRNWHNIHQVISMIDNLTYRQIAMIKLLADNRLAVKDRRVPVIYDPDACVEMWKLSDIGVWRTEGITFGKNNSYRLQCNNIIPTKYCRELSERLMLDTLNPDDIDEVFMSMNVGYAEIPPEETEYPDDTGAIKKIDYHLKDYGVED